MLGDGNWLAATARNPVHQRKPIPMNTEYGDAAATRVYGQQERAIFGQCERSLRSQWMVTPPLPRPPVEKRRPCSNEPSAFRP